MAGIFPGAKLSPPLFALPSDLYLQTLSISRCPPRPFPQLLYQTGCSLGIHLSEFSKPLRNCTKGMASLIPDSADGQVDGKQEKPEKILFLHLVVLEALTYIIVLPDKTVLCFWQFVNANW
jgi:hypothetical protein